MKKYLLLITLLACAYSLTAQNKFDKEPYTVNHFNNVKVTNVHVETTGGNITVTGENSADARVEVYVSPNNSRNSSLTKEQIKQKLEADYDWSVSFANNTVTAIAKHKKTKDSEIDWRDALNISFKIFVPKNVGSDLKTSGGNITLSSLNGTQEFRTSGGNLSLDDMSGTMKGGTSGGNVSLKNSKDNIDLSTSGGNITAENDNGKIKLTTSGGNLELSGLKGDIHATTSGGNVHGDHISGDIVTSTSGGSVGLKDMSGSVDASTSGGTIDLSITNLGGKISLNNSGGNIYLELPANKGMDLRLSGSSIRTDALANFKGTHDKERVEGSLNGGGISVRVNANSGTIRLSLK